MAKWLTEWVWQGANEKERRATERQRQKTVLAFDDDEDERLVGFATWRMMPDEEIDGQLRTVGEIRYMGVVEDRRGEGIGGQLAANAVQALREEGGSDLFVRIDVDTDNADAWAAYEHWGFGHHRHFVSNGTPYEMLVLPPVAKDDGNADASD